MASPQASQKIASRLGITMWDHDPGTTNALGVSPDGGTTLRVVDMRDLAGFGVACMTTILGGSGPTLLEIVACTGSDGTGTITQIKTSGTIAADAMGDWAWLECTAEEVAQEAADAGAALRYVYGRITCQNAGDEAVVVYVTVPRYADLNETAATTIA